MLQGKKVLIGITASIAAYKIISLVRLLDKAGAEVKVVMTPAAHDFASALTLATLSKNEVATEMFTENTWANHVMLGRWADVMLIAPLSCNTLAKMSTGICDNVLMAVYLSATCPVMVAPAMDEDMWEHPATQRNLQQIEKDGVRVIPVEVGALASGLTGPGRMAEPEHILTEIVNFLDNQQRLKDKKVLVTAGPTYEHVDPVRFIGNHSSGKMGIAIANELHQQGAGVTLVAGPVNTQNVHAGIEIINVTSAAEMLVACEKNFENADIVVMAAAVADYTPTTVANQKIKKKEDDLTIHLTKTRDILRTLGNGKTTQILVGFALETDNEEQNALTKLQKKNADMIVLNSLNDAEAGFGKDTNKITIFTKAGKKIAFEAKSKTLVAKDIVNTIIQEHYA